MFTYVLGFLAIMCYYKHRLIVYYMKNIFKKLLVSCAVLVAISTVFSIISAPATFAESSDVGKCNYLLGLTSWNCGIHEMTSQDEIGYNIWTIVANVVTDITVIAAYLVIGYVIYGGYLYVFSAGDPGKVASGRKTLAHAFIGLAIVMGAWAIMSTIRFVLVSGNLGDCVTNQCVAPEDLVIQSIQWAVAVVGIVAAIFIVYGGASYITSAGDPGKVKRAKDIILYALIGIIIVALAEIITAFVSNIIRDSISQTNEITIAKEVYENNPN